MTKESPERREVKKRNLCAKRKKRKFITENRNNASNRELPKLRNDTSKNTEEVIDIII